MGVTFSIQMSEKSLFDAVRGERRRERCLCVVLVGQGEGQDSGYFPPRPESAPGGEEVHKIVSGNAFSLDK